MIKLGTKVKDSITGFEGVATSRVEYLTGCTQIGIASPVDKDGKVPDVVYLDESRLDGTDLQDRASLKNPGGPQLSIRKRDCPSAR